MIISIKSENKPEKCPIFDINQWFVSDVLLNLIITIGRIMTESAEKTPSPAQAPIKKGKKTWMVALAAVVVVVLLVLVVVMGGFLNSNESTLDKIKKQGKIVMATEASFDPFESYNGTNIVGFDIDLAQKITENVSKSLNMSIQLEVKDYVFKNIPAALQTKSIDMSLSGMTITDLRNKSVLFSTPYYMMQGGLGLLVRSSFDSVHNISDLAGKKIVVNTGTTSEDWVQKNLTSKGLISTPTSLDTIDGCVQDVISGHSDIFIIDNSTCAAYVDKTAGAVKVAAVIPGVEPYGVAMNLGSTDLKAIVDKTINGMITSGEMQALMVKWKLV
ncbi:MAG TPA: ABC transporter substrate-binding protein [Methanomassiliicoccales archaeon]|jgi:polar amino acid transport system substrate-binding protein